MRVCMRSLHLGFFPQFAFWICRQKHTCVWKFFFIMRILYFFGIIMRIQKYPTLFSPCMRKKIPSFVCTIPILMSTKTNTILLIDNSWQSNFCPHLSKVCVEKKNHNHINTIFLAMDEGQGPCSVTVKLFDNASDFF